MTSGLADDLLAGPRGRRTCWAVAHDRRLDAAGVYFELLQALRQEGLTQSVLTLFRDAIRPTDLSEISKWSDEVQLLNFVADSVGSARYWQDPDDTDRLLAAVGVDRELRPIAAAIESAPASSWWPSPVALGEQVFVDWRPRSAGPRHLTGAQDILREWKLEASEWSSEWWSPPIHAELANTTRCLANLGAVGLLLGQGDMSGTFATCWSVRCRHQPRVYEINGANEWIELVKRHSIEVTRGAWSMATDLNVHWLLPDWTQVAEEFDAVHLSVSGYLAISGRPLFLDVDMATFVAGWEPDETYWLTDILQISGPGVEWKGVGQGHPSRDWRVADSGSD